MEMTITSGKLLINTGSSDELLLETSIDSEVWPFTAKQIFKTHIANGHGLGFIKKSFSEVPIEIIDLKSSK